MNNSHKTSVIAIDGPAASGKSTVAWALAERLGFQLLDSGSMYRSVTLRALEEEISLDNEERLIDIAGEVRRDFSFSFNDDGPPKVLLAGRDVTEDIRSSAVGNAVSPVSVFEGVRNEMVLLQRDMVSGKDVVVEGRDIGTIVFPDARLKIYLDAAVEERVRRRFDELKEKGAGITRPDIEKEIRLRDSIDSSRELSPLEKATDAVRIDTTGMTIEEVVSEIVSVWGSMAK